MKQSHSSTPEMLLPEDEAATKGLTLLIVEDDQLSREILLTNVADHFKHIYTAEDGSDGYQRYCEYHPDIVLTDQIMPGISGLGLLAKIRNSGAKTPVILMTSSIDNETLLEAINLGVGKFIPKPFDYTLLINTLTAIAKEILGDRLIEHHRHVEIELLRYQNYYNSLQQESASRKERHVVRNDLCSQVLNGVNNVRWGIQVSYLPKDIMCGDGYSVRNLFDGRQLIYLVDAMGSGMSASLTAMLTTSFCSYQVENLHLWGHFTLQLYIKRFQEYLSGMLLEEEVVSCGFFLVDLIKEEIETAIFALPPFFLRGMDGSINWVRGENPPLGIYPSTIKTSSLSLSGISDMLVMTDGVSDAHLVNGGTYREIIESDYRESPTLAAVQRRFMQQTESGDRDDLTLLHLHRLGPKPDWIWKVQPDLSLGSIHKAVDNFLDALQLETYLNDYEMIQVETMVTEALINAYEHGCIGIIPEERKRLKCRGLYQHALEGKGCLQGKEISFSAMLWFGAGKPLLNMEISDTGPGLTVNELDIYTGENFVDGNGLKKIAAFSDSLYIDKPAGSLIILKTLEGEICNAT